MLITKIVSSSQTQASELLKAQMLHLKQPHLKQFAHEQQRISHEIPFAALSLFKAENQVPWLLPEKPPNLDSIAVPLFTILRRAGLSNPTCFNNELAVYHLDDVCVNVLPDGHLLINCSALDTRIRDRRKKKEEKQQVVIALFVFLTLSGHDGLAIIVFYTGNQLGISLYHIHLVFCLFCVTGFCNILCLWNGNMTVGKRFTFDKNCSWHPGLHMREDRCWTFSSSIEQQGW